MKMNLIIKPFLLSLFLFHIIFTIIYLLPNNYLKKSFGYVSYFYMDNFFYQNWHLFSPNPGLSYKKIWIQCEDNYGHYKEWEDPLEQLQKTHEKFRIFYHGKLLYYYRDIMENVDLLNSNISAQNKSGHSYKSIINALKKFCKIDSDVYKPKKVNVRTAIIHPFPFSYRNEMKYKPFYKFYVTQSTNINLD